MNLSLLIRPEAEEDIASARNWYEEQREGLGEEFVAELDRYFALLTITPGSRSGRASW